MTWDDVSPGGTPHDRGVAADDLVVDDLLDGRRRAETEDEMSLDRLLGALRAPGTADELRGLDAAVAAFVQARAEAAAAPAPVLVAVGGRNRRSVAAGVAVAAMLATVSMGAAAAAAYTGSLPRPLQEAAHAVLGAPAPEADAAEADGAEADGAGRAPVTAASTASGPTGSALGVGPSVTAGAPELFGLCTAFRDRGPSAVPTGSVAYRNLLAAASAAGKDIQTYCTGVLPGGSHGPSVTPSGRPTAHPTPSRKPTAHPTPTRKPTDVPRSQAPAPRSSAAKGSAPGR
jgi:hypothetical protein